MDPSIQTTYPEPGDNLAPIDATLMAYFDEEIYAGTGSVLIKKQSDDSVFESFDISENSTGGAIEIDENLLIIRPTTSFEYLTGYYIDIRRTW
ncbi:MAG: Ig-like domain-containing protein [Bacteroidales bacterium]